MPVLATDDGMVAAAEHAEAWKGSFTAPTRADPLGAADAGRAPIARRTPPAGPWRKAEVLIPRPGGPYRFRAGPGAPVQFTFRVAQSHEHLVTGAGLEPALGRNQRPKTLATPQHVWCQRSP